jgi:hypothetical protein
MDAIEILLDDLQQGAAQAARMSDVSGVYVLTAENDIVVNLHEEVATDRVTLFASPGYLHCTSLPRDQQQPWTNEAFDHPDDPEARRMLRADTETGMVLLVHSFTRGQLDLVRFRVELEHFVSACRHLKSMLAAAAEIEA